MIRGLHATRSPVAVLLSLALLVAVATYGVLGAFVTSSESTANGDVVTTDRDYVGSVPGCTVLLTGLPSLGYAVVGDLGVYLGAGVAVLVALAGGLGLLTLLVRRALRRSRGVVARS